MRFQTFIFVAVVCQSLKMSVAVTESNTDTGILVIAKKIGIVSQNYLSIAIDTSFLTEKNIFKMIEKKPFIKMMKALSPAHLRLGGTAADLLVFEENEESTSDRLQERSLKKALNRFNYLHDRFWAGDRKGCRHKTRPLPHVKLSGKEWTALNQLARRSNLDLLFDLNILLRTSSGAWNSSNAEELLKFSEKNGFKVDWQLGNEPNSFCHVFGYEMCPQQLAMDYHVLSQLLKKYPMYQNSLLVGPDVTRPKFNIKPQKSSQMYFDNFLEIANSFISVASWHQYYVNGHNATKESFMDPSILNVLHDQILEMKRIVSGRAGKTFPMWISETSSAFGGGAPGLSDRYIGGFMWLDKLGVAATHNVSVVIRQTVVGDSYALIDFKTLKPNPDFWVSVIYKQLVGRRVLNVSQVVGGSNLRLYAHCPRNTEGIVYSGDIVMFGMNLGKEHYNSTIASQSSTNSSIYDIEAYILTAPENDLLSKHIMLNGKLLQLTKSGGIPVFTPFRYTGKTVSIPPYSMVFYVVHGLEVTVELSDCNWGYY